MKNNLVVILVSLVGAVAASNLSHAQTHDSNVGVYRDCVQWTTVNGVEHSKGFELEFGQDSSMRIDVLFYVGTSDCQGQGELVARTENFKVIRRMGVGENTQYVYAKDRDSDDYYKIMFSDGTALIQRSEGLPFKYEFDNSLLLKKAR